MVTYNVVIQGRSGDGVFVCVKIFSEPRDTGFIVFVKKFLKGVNWLNFFFV